MLKRRDALRAGVGLIIGLVTTGSVQHLSNGMARAGVATLSFMWGATLSGGSAGADLALRVNRPLELRTLDAAVTAAASGSGAGPCRVRCAAAYIRAAAFASSAPADALLPHSAHFGPTTVHNPVHLRAQAHPSVAQGMLWQVALGFWRPATAPGGAASRQVETRPAVALAGGDHLGLHVEQSGLPAAFTIALTCTYVLREHA